jgi:hypothetical protein
MQRAAARFYDDRRGSIYIGRARWRHRERGQIHARAPRGERAEACALLVQVMAARLDLGTKRVNDYRTGRGLSVDRLVELSGMSRARVQGAIHDLGACGYLGTFQARDDDGKRWRGLVARRWFTGKLLALLSPPTATPRPPSSPPPRTSPAPSSPAIDYAATWPRPPD